jgi:hypothetical protein
MCLAQSLDEYSDAVVVPSKESSKWPCLMTHANVKDEDRLASLTIVEVL